jgi:phage replication O-like protein O
MKDLNSQEGSDKPKKSREEVKRKKGHMALRNNVYDLKLELWHILKPLEYYLVDVIIDKTIKWREKEARITIQELMERTRLTRHTHIYEALKSLEEKKIIFRRKQNHNLIIGLNEDFFGGLLIKRHEDALLARKGKIKMIVDNSKKGVNSLSQPGTTSVPNSDKSNPDSGQHMSGKGTENDIQDFEIIEEKRSLNTLLKDISLNTSLQSDQSSQNAKTGTELHSSFSGTGTRKPKRTQEEHERIIKEQLAQMKAQAVG